MCVCVCVCVCWIACVACWQQAGRTSTGSCFCGRETVSAGWLNLLYMQRFITAWLLVCVCVCVCVTDKDQYECMLCVCVWAVRLISSWEMCVCVCVCVFALQHSCNHVVHIERSLFNCCVSDQSQAVIQSCTQWHSYKCSNTLKRQNIHLRPTHFCCIAKKN